MLFTCLSVACCCFDHQSDVITKHSSISQVTKTKTIYLLQAILSCSMAPDSIIMLYSILVICFYACIKIKNVLKVVVDSVKLW